MRVVCSICGKSEVVYEFPLQIDLSRRKTKTKALCKQCFNEYIMDKAFSEFDKLDLHSPKSVLVAYSGECDSAFMLTLLQEYKKQRNLDFTIYPTLVCHNSSKVAISRDKTARQLTTLLGVPLKVLNAKDILGKDSDEYFVTFRSSGYDLNKFNRCRVCGDIRDILLYSARKALSTDLMVVGRNKDDEVADYLLQLISPPHNMHIYETRAFLRYPIREFTDHEIRLYLELNSIPCSFERCVYEKFMPRREVSAWINNGKADIFELSNRLYGARESVMKKQAKLSYTECPHCGFPHAKETSCPGCRLLKRYGLSSDEICKKIID